MLSLKDSFPANAYKKWLIGNRFILALLNFGFKKISSIGLRFLHDKRGRWVKIEMKKTKDIPFKICLGIALIVGRELGKLLFS